MSIVSQSSDGKLKQHTNDILFLRKNEPAENLPFRIQANSDEYIFFIAVITDRPTNQPYKWFQKLISNPLESGNLKNTILCVCSLVPVPCDPQKIKNVGGIPYFSWT